MLAIILSFGAIDALVPLLIVVILIAAAAGLTRGYSIFKALGIGTLAGISQLGLAGKGSIAGKTAFSKNPIKAKGVGRTFATKAATPGTPGEKAGKKIRSALKARSERTATEKAKTQLTDSAVASAFGGSAPNMRGKKVRMVAGSLVQAGGIITGGLIGGGSISKIGSKMRTNASYERTKERLRQPGLTPQETLNLAKKAEKQRESLGLPHPTSIEEVNAANLLSADIKTKAHERYQRMVSEGLIGAGGALGPGGPTRYVDAQLVAPTREAIFEAERQVALKNRLQAIGIAYAGNPAMLMSETQTAIEDYTNSGSTWNAVMTPIIQANAAAAVTRGSITAGTVYPISTTTRRVKDMLEFNVSRKRGAAVAAASAFTLGGAYAVHFAERKLRKLYVRRYR